MGLCSMHINCNACYFCVARQSRIQLKNSAMLLHYKRIFIIQRAQISLHVTEIITKCFKTKSVCWACHISSCFMCMMRMQNELVLCIDSLYLWPMSIENSVSLKFTFIQFKLFNIVSKKEKSLCHTITHGWMFCLSRCIQHVQQ